jgi:hypothetical protein
MKYNIKYVCCDTATVLVQKFWETIKTVHFYDFKYCSNNVLTDGLVVCIWKIKPKSI